MSTISFSDLKTSVKARCFPTGTPENMDTSVNQFIVEALILIQRYVSSYQQTNVDVFTQASGTYTACGITFLARPRGKIKGLRNRLQDIASIHSDDWTATTDAEEQADCDTYWYDPVDREEIELVAEEMNSIDLSGCRLRWGNYCVGMTNVSVSPPLAEGEQIEMEWSGIKRSYGDDDLLPDEPEMLAAVCQYVDAEMAKKYDHDMEAYQMAASSFQDKLAELLQDAREHGVELPDSRDVDMVPPVKFSFVSDGGLAGDNQSAVSRLIKLRNPEILVFGGDNNMPSGAQSTLLDNWAVYQNEVDQCRVLAALGNHDLDTEDGGPQLAFLSQQTNGRYFRFRKGCVEFFVLNGGVNSAGALVEADGNTSSSTQGQWLEAALADSKATWKVVVVHHAPYTSDTVHAPGTTDLRWSFKDWGADVVLSGHGHQYERLIIDDFPYIVVGTGGVALRDISYPIQTGSMVASKTFGALFGQADNNKLLLRYYDVDNQLVDIYAIR